MVDNGLNLYCGNGLMSKELEEIIFERISGVMIVSFFFTH